jgi:hypothetical protein
MWVTEVSTNPILRRDKRVDFRQFACVDDSTGFVPCTDQSEINSFIWTAVQIFESDSRVAGYAYS